MRLVACPDCHRQFDVTRVVAAEIRCACGAAVPNAVHAPVEAAVHRCGSCGAGLGAEAERCDYCAAPVVRDPGALSLICPECFARNAEDSRFCTACGVAFDPSPVAEPGEELPCVDCGGLMPPREVAGTPLNECPGCNGLWVRGDAFDDLVARAVDAARKSAPEGLATAEARAPRVAGGNPARREVRYRKCPVCEAFMHRKNYRKCSGVILDVCHDHGTWLDADELEEIAGFILANGGVPPVKEFAEPKVTTPLPDLSHDFRYGRRSDSAGGLGRSLLGLIAALLE